MSVLKVGCLLSVILLGLTGCATIFGDNSRAVQIKTTPIGATVIVNNGETSVTTPAAVIVPSTWSSTTIRVQKAGYQAQTFVIDPIFQPVGLWNILIWPGFIVDACSGDMMRVPIEARTFTATLVPVSPVH